MAYQTIRDLVTHVRSMHRRLRNEARQAQVRADDERSALLLEVIDEHESAIERAVETAERSGESAVLDTWLQFEPNAEVERAMRQRETASSGADDVVSHILETENALMRLYELLQGSNSSPRVQSFFSSLLELEDSAVRRAARAKLEAEDV